MLSPMPAPLFFYFDRLPPKALIERDAYHFYPRVANLLVEKALVGKWTDSCRTGGIVDVFIGSTGPVKWMG